MEAKTLGRKMFNNNIAHDNIRIRNRYLHNIITRIYNVLNELYKAKLKLK